MNSGEIDAIVFKTSRDRPEVWRHIIATIVSSGWQDWKLDLKFFLLEL